MSVGQRTWSAPGDGADLKTWEDIKLWRCDCRAELLGARIMARNRRRSSWSAAIDPKLRAVLAEHKPAIIGFYWPFKGEFDARDLVNELCASGWQAALPAVKAPKSPLEFRGWIPGEPLLPGVWKIPVPEQRRIVTPTVVLIPLVGFDGEHYRLGYGGGYYDRTLASLSPRPLAVGIGFEQGHLATIYPQPHDIPMDIIVTESGTF